MNEINWLNIILGFLGGFGLFLFGMEYLGEGLQKATGSRVKKLLKTLTGNRFLGVLVGAGITGLIHSSAATTVMVVGFVNSGLMSLQQSVGVIMGANIGTTVTAWIVSLGGGGLTELLKPTVTAPICIIIGVVLSMFTKKQNIKHIGQSLFGMGVLFLGLEMMSQAVLPLSTLDEVKEVFVTLGSNPILGILAGTIVTAVIQSSTASIGILQALATAALVPWNSAVYIILGQNIGTCITAILSSISASKDAKRAAMIHLLFNVISAVIFGVLGFAAFQFIIPAFAKSKIDIVEISIFHSVYNIIGTILLFPFASSLIALSKMLITGTDDNAATMLLHLDERMLETPSFAVGNAVKEVVRMGNICIQNAKTAMEALVEKDSAKLQEVLLREKVINKLQHGINHYLVQLSNASLSEKDHGVITGLFHTVSDIERVGDHAENIAELAQLLIEEQQDFSETACKELEEIASTAIKCFEMALQAYEFDDKIIAEQALPLEKTVDELEEALRSRHIQRLSKSQCSSVVGVIFLDVISNLERISDHAANIAMTLLDDHKASSSEYNVVSAVHE